MRQAVDGAAREGGETLDGDAVAAAGTLVRLDPLPGEPQLAGDVASQNSGSASADTAGPVPEGAGLGSAGGGAGEAGGEAGAVASAIIFPRIYVSKAG